MEDLFENLTLNTDQVSLLKSFTEMFQLQLTSPFLIIDGQLSCLYH